MAAPAAVDRAEQVGLVQLAERLGRASLQPAQHVHGGAVHPDVDAVEGFDRACGPARSPPARRARPWAPRSPVRLPPRIRRPPGAAARRPGRPAPGWRPGGRRPVRSARPMPLDAPVITTTLPVICRAMVPPGACSPPSGRNMGARWAPAKGSRRRGAGGARATGHGPDHRAAPLRNYPTRGVDLRHAAGIVFNSVPTAKSRTDAGS